MPIKSVSNFLSGQAQAQTARDYLQAYLKYVDLLTASDHRTAKMLLLLQRLGAVQVGGRAVTADALHDGLHAAVAAEVKRLGYPLVESTETGAFALDFSVVDPKTGLFGLGIECDAPSHELLTIARAREIWRPNTIKRSVPAPYRISSRQWLSDPQREKARLRHAMQLACGDKA